MLRRGFLLVCTSAVTGLWFRETGLTQLSRQLVIELSGDCSFCGNSVQKGEVATMARAVGTRVRICSECIDLCLDIVELPAIVPAARAHSKPDIPRYERPTLIDEDDTMAALCDLLKIRQGAHESHYAAAVDRMIATMRAQIDGIALSTSSVVVSDKVQHQESGVYSRGECHCAFCRAAQEDVERMIAGPSIYICDRCVCEAAAVTKKLTERVV